MIILADCHIKQRTWSNYGQLSGDAYAALAAVRKFHDRENAVVVCGDMFDINRPTSEDVLQVVNTLRHFQQVLYIPGNHDSVQPSWLELLKFCGVEVIQLSSEPYLLPVSGIPVYGCGNVYNREELLTFLRGLPVEGSPAYVVLHTGFRHLLGYNESWQLSLEDIKEIFPTQDVRILVGHVHTRNLTEFNSNGGYILSPGSLYPTSWDKTQQPCSIPVVDESTGSVTFHDCAVRAYHQFRYDTAQDTPTSFYKDLQALQEANTYELPPMVRVVLPPDSPDPTTLKAPEGVLVQFVKAAEEAQVAELQHATTGSGISLEQAALEEVPADNQLLQGLVSTLVQSDDPVATIEEWLSFWGAERTHHA